MRDLSNTKQEIINFRKIVRPQRAALGDLERTKRYIPEGLDIYFDDINDANERVWDMLENFKEVIEGLESTNESVISHRLNDLLRVLTNFVDNALKYTRHGGILVSARPRGDRLRLAVWDTGLGIAPEHLPWVEAYSAQLSASANPTGVLRRPVRAAE